MTFGNWPDEIHDDPDQKKRLASSASIKTKPQNIDTVNQTGVFIGSAAIPYVTTLNSCTCVDYMRRRLPCKHIYRLAAELGLMGSTFNKSAARMASETGQQISLEDAVAELEKMQDRSQMLFLYFLRRSNAGFTEHIVPAICVGGDLLKCALIEMVDSPLAVLESFKRGELMAVLDAHGIAGFKRNMNISAMANWCLNNVDCISDILPKVYVFRFVDSFKKYRNKVLSYLSRKYETVTLSYVDVYGVLRTESVSAGSDLYTVEAETEDGSKIYEERWLFPNDNISRLLEQYGHLGEKSFKDFSLLNKSFVLAGEFSKISVYEIRKALEAYGGTIFATVNQKTGYVIVGSNPGAKLQEAEALGIPVLTEDELLGMLQIDTVAT